MVTGQHLALLWDLETGGLVTERGLQAQGSVLPLLFSRPVVSDSLRPWGLNPKAPLSTGVFQARTLKQVALLFSRGSSQPRDQTSVSCIVGRFFTIRAPWEAPVGGVGRFFFSSSFAQRGNDCLRLCGRARPQIQGTFERAGSSQGALHNPLPQPDGTGNKSPLT